MIEREIRKTEKKKLIFNSFFLLLLLLLLLLLHFVTQHFVWSHDGLDLWFKFHATIHEMVKLKEMIGCVIHQLKIFFHYSGSQLNFLHKTLRILYIFWLNERSQLSEVLPLQPN